MTGPLWVDPALLSDAGESVAAVGNGLVAAVAGLTSSYGANTGQDAAGTAFGFAYQNSAHALVGAVATGVNAARRAGFLVQGSATNYSRAEAAADVSGRTSPLPAPAAPQRYSAPGGDPDVNGPGQSPPVLWYLVEFLVGDWWPNGSPGELRAAAGAWRAFAGPLYDVTGANAGAYAAIGAQRIPERGSMQAVVRDIGTAMSGVAGDCQAMADQLDRFAADVENVQNAIRDLLDKLKSVVSVGITGMVFELLTGDAEERIREVADDIKAVVANHERQSQARKELIARLEENLKAYSREVQIIARKELVDYFGEGTGYVLANVHDAANDIGVGITLGGINTVEGLVTGIDPIGDPKGTWETVTGLGKMAMTFNPMTAPIAFAADPGGTVDLVKGLTHFDDIVTSNRPFIGVGEAAFDIGSAVVPGGGAVKAASAVKGVEEAGRVARAGEQVVGRVGGLTQATRGLGEMSRSAGKVADGLDAIAGKPMGIASPGPGTAPTGPIAHHPAQSSTSPARHVPDTAVHSVEPAGSAPHDGLAPRGDDQPYQGSESHSADHPDATDVIPPLLIRESPYETGGIAPDYLGEHYPNGPMGSPGVIYLDDVARERFRISIRDGLVYDSNGNLFDTRDGVSAFGSSSSGRAIFVMDEHGNLYASTYQAFGIFHHSSFLGGGEVAAAGELVVKDGRIELVTDRSGHYMPGRSRTQQFLDHLANWGIVMDTSGVRLFAPPGS